MKQKKTMRLWQMIIILLLSVTMIITMFLPAFRIDGKAFRKQMDMMTGDGMLEDLGLGADGLSMLAEEGMENQIGGLEEEIKEYESETNTRFSKISPFRIMTHSFVKFIAGDKAAEKQQEIDQMEETEKDVFVKLQKNYNMARIVLWVIYSLALVIILLVLLGFMLKWNKMIPLVINTVYGVAAAIIFGYLRFGLMKGIAKKLTEAALAESGMSGMFGLTGITSSVLSKVLSCYYSVAFLIAFIVAILIIVMSIVSILTGNRVAADNDALTDEWGLGENIQTIADQGIEIKGNNQFYGQINEESIPTQPVSTPIEPVYNQSVIVPKQPKVAPAPKMQPMGQVRCTKGVAVGQGFMIPQDKKVIVGKSSQNANLVINNQNVSNIHCSIRYNPGMNTYIIKDHSMNGTFVNGVRLQKDAAIEYPAGTVLSLADGSNEITLG